MVVVASSSCVVLRKKYNVMDLSMVKPRAGSSAASVTKIRIELKLNGSLLPLATSVTHILYETGIDFVFPLYRL